MLPAAWSAKTTVRATTAPSFSTGVTRLCPATSSEGRFFQTGNGLADYGCGTAHIEEGIGADAFGIVTCRPSRSASRLPSTSGSAAQLSALWQMPEARVRDWLERGHLELTVFDLLSQEVTRGVDDLDLGDVAALVEENVAGEKGVLGFDELRTLDVPNRSELLEGDLLAAGCRHQNATDRFDTIALLAHVPRAHRVALPTLDGSRERLSANRDLNDVLNAADGVDPRRANEFIRQMNELIQQQPEEE